MVTTYLFQGLKTNPDDVVFHAIGGDYPSGCGGNDAYTGMYEASVATGGLFFRFALRTGQLNLKRWLKGLHKT